MMVISAPQDFAEPLLDVRLEPLGHVQHHLIARGLHIPTFRESDFASTPFTHINYDSTVPHKVPILSFPHTVFLLQGPSIPML